MAVAPRAKPHNFFTTAEWAMLSARSQWRGIWLVAHCWAVIGVAMALAARWPATLPLVVMVVGTRQLGLFILMHDAAHAVLHRDRSVNDWVGYWFCSSALYAYRTYHLQHHRYVQQTEDPDLVLSAPFPITRLSLLRKVVRDLTGQTFLKQRFGPLLQSVRGEASGRSKLTTLGAELSKNRRFFIGNSLGFCAFAAFDYGWLWLGAWLLPMATWLQMVSRFRNIAEHALIAQNEADPRRQARTTRANAIERAMLAPYWVNYHCEHHMFTSVPCWKLPLAHELLHRQRQLPHMEIASGYVALLARASSAERTAVA